MFNEQKVKLLFHKKKSSSFIDFKFNDKYTNYIDNNNAQQILDSKYGIICNIDKPEIKLNYKEIKEIYKFNNKGIMEREYNETDNDDIKDDEKNRNKYQY